MRVLILGGYGVFGGRLAELISDIPQLDLLICGRDLARATAFCQAYRGLASVTPLKVDRADIGSVIARQSPDLVVDASGPFQDYGNERYRVVTSCIAAGVDYLDFADAADFVSGVSQFDDAAKAAGVFALSGVSSFPALTSAVLHDMASRMDILSVDAGVAPSPHAGIGLNVVRAIAGYAGSPVGLLRNGEHRTASALVESMRFTIAVPGHLPLKNNHFSLVEVPDLQVIPPEHQQMRDIWVGAGPTPEILHRMLNLFAMARAKFALPSLVPLSRLFYSVLNVARFGEHRGGMFIRASGRRDGVTVAESWHLLAEGDDGPYIPAMPIEALVRKQLAGVRPANGARPATRALDLEDFHKLFEHRSLYTGFRQSACDQTASPYRNILGSAFEDLPEQIRLFHGSRDTRRWTGKAEVKRGEGLIAQTICRLFGFPQAAQDVSVTVEVEPSGSGEIWTRRFGGKAFSSTHSPGRGRNDYLVVERFGAISVALALVTEANRLYLVPRRWFFLGIPLPKLFLPSGASFETVRDDKFCFDVEISAPLVGLIVAYKGELVLE